MKHNSLNKRILQLLLTPAFIAISCFYLLVVATRFAIGYWPKYHYPDAGVLGNVPFPTWHVVVFILLALALLSGPVGLAGAIVTGLKKKRNLMTYCLLCIATWGAGLAITQIDPGGFFSWYFD